MLIIKAGLAGKGVFTTQKIPKGSVVFTFSNKIIDIDHVSGCNCEVCCRCIQIGEIKWLQPDLGSFGWNLNHSCRPNCGMIGHDIVSIARIKPGEEITVDYSTTTTDAGWSMVCLCGEKNCRKIIRSVQFLPKKIFTKYVNVMPKYIADNYML